jgi:predicted DNA-binding transcriptional regulator YafY
MTALADTGERFVRPKDFSAAGFLQSAFGVMTGSGDYEVLVEFDAWATDLMRGRVWHDSQVVAPLEAGRSIFRVRVSCLDEVGRWVLGWGAHAKVIEPAELAEQVVLTACEIGQRYRVPV